MPADPKPRKRVRARTPAERERAYALPDGTMCLVCEAAPPQRAHVVPRSQGGDDVRENIMPLCLWCHWWVDQGAHGQSKELVRAWIDSEPDVLAYVLERKGQAWLDRRYPRR